MSSDFFHDETRLSRLGMPEAIYCEGKDTPALAAILAHLTQEQRPALLTRLAVDRQRELATELRAAMDYDARSFTGIVHGCLPPRQGSVAVVTAGTSDLQVAGEAQRTLQFSGFSAQLIADVGVAGIHRLFARLDEIRGHDVVIVVAGWDAALASVMGGLVSQPVIAVPSSTGYGVASGGQTSLNAMLASCGQGVMVTNIDNGFGAACGAVRILNRMFPQ